MSKAFLLCSTERGMCRGGRDSACMLIVLCFFAAAVAHSYVAYLQSKPLPGWGHIFLESKMALPYFLFLLFPLKVSSIESYLEKWGLSVPISYFRFMARWSASAWSTVLFRDERTTTAIMSGHSAPHLHNCNGLTKTTRQWLRMTCRGLKTCHFTPSLVPCNFGIFSQDGIWYFVVFCLS